MHESEIDTKWVADQAKPVEGELISTGPSEAELVSVALQMRLYDVMLAILKYFNREEAERIYKAHSEGETFNPAIFVPEIGNDE